MQMPRIESVMLLSPHSDDIALSGAGWLSTFIPRFGVTANLVTIFSQSKWAPNVAGQDPVLIKRQRLSEDTRYADQLGVDFSYLDLLDSSMIGLDEVQELQSWPTSGMDPRAAKLRSWLSDYVSKSSCILALPIGVGFHVDHRLAANVVADLNPARVLYMEDMPYAIEAERGSFESLCKARHCHPYSVTGTLMQARKKENALRLYGSQFTEQEIERCVMWYLERGEGIGVPEGEFGDWMLLTLRLLGLEIKKLPT